MSKSERARDGDKSSKKDRAEKVLSAVRNEPKMMSKFFTKKEFEVSIYGLVAKSDYQAVGAATLISPAILSQYFNPSHIRESILFKAACVLAGFISEASPARGREMLRRFNSFVERALPEADNSVQGRILEAVNRAEINLEDVRMMAAAMPVRQLAQVLVADRYQRSKAA